MLTTDKVDDDGEDPDVWKGENGSYGGEEGCSAHVEGGGSARSPNECQQ